MWLLPHQPRQPTAFYNCTKCLYAYLSNSVSIFFVTFLGVIRLGGFKSPEFCYSYIQWLVRRTTPPIIGVWRGTRKHGHGTLGWANLRKCGEINRLWISACRTRFRLGASGFLALSPPSGIHLCPCMVSGSKWLSPMFYVVSALSEEDGFLWDVGQDWKEMMPLCRGNFGSFLVFLGMPCFFHRCSKSMQKGSK